MTSLRKRYPNGVAAGAELASSGRSGATSAAGGTEAAWPSLVQPLHQGLKCNYLEDELQLLPKSAQMV